MQEKEMVRNINTNIMELRKENYKALWDGFYNFYQLQLKTLDDKAGFNFNILREQCGNIVENSHTNILMRVLQYKNRYGYVFLEDFFSLAGFDIHIADDEVMFSTEYQSKTSVIQGRIDGLIWQKNHFAIIIENKINHAGNQQRQIARYVETVVSDGIASKDNIYVVFLTRDGIEVPDNDSQQYLKNCGVCEIIGDEEVSGSRYFACSYSEHIYNWLKDAVQPMITQKDVVMNAGVIQYIDFLDGMLGYEAESSAMQQICEKWFADNVKIAGDVTQQNASLYDFYKILSVFNPNDEDAKRKNDCINILKNVIDQENEQLMSQMLIVTKECLASGKNPVIREYHLNHHFTYYYITIRDKKWPRGFEFGWYPLGMKRLKEEKDLTLYFKFKGQRLDNIQEREIGELGFYYNEKSRTYRKTITIPDSSSFLDLNREKQRLFLETVYNKYVVTLLPRNRL